MSAPAAIAELLEDGGRAAAGEDFFRSPEFLDAEGATHTLRIEAGEEELVASLVVREIGEGPERDATSPYGYPGIARRGRPPSAGGREGGSPIELGPAGLSATGLVSVFIRHTLGEPPLSGARKRNVVQIADPSLPAKSRPSDRNQINRNVRAGYSVRIAPGPEAGAGERAAFLEAYEQTMRRAGAGERYFFGAGYFDRILRARGTWLALALDPRGEVAAASIAVRSDGFLHYYLSGTADRWLRDSPMKNVVAALVELSAELGLPLNLGGGIERGDRLEEFKRGFANREEHWHSSELVCDPAAYERLSGGREAGDHFPAYRAGS